MDNFNFLDLTTFRKIILDNIDREGGYFINRIGGSDYSAASDYYLNNGHCNEIYIDSVTNLNGYFDKEKDPIKRVENFYKYMQILIDCYKISDCFTSPCNEIQNHLDDVRLKFNKFICENKPITHYTYIESIYDFLNDFKIFAEGKKILIISPFSESIQYQYKFKDNLINNYKYPEFTLLTYETPITYNDGTEDLSFIKTNNWIEQSESMSKDISILDFDIALLSCASYAWYLGSFISTKMKKKAIYIGGVMNILFNIKGSRYIGNEFYESINNQNYAIEAIEKRKYEERKGGRKYKSESFNAYF